MFTDNARGSVAIGFALVLPILALMLTSIAELGIMYYNKQVITNATRVAAREGSIYGTSNGHNPSQTAMNYCHSRMICLGDTDASSLSEEDVTVTTSGEHGSEKVTVAISYRYSFLLNKLVGIEDDKNTSWINAQTTMNVEQYSAKKQGNDNS